MTTTTEEELLATARKWAFELRGDHEHAESNRDDWFAAMPHGISADWLKKAETLEAIVALIERHRAEANGFEMIREQMAATIARHVEEKAAMRAEVERLTVEKNKAEHDIQTVIRASNALASQLEHQRDAADSSLAAAQQRVEALEAALEECVALIISLDNDVPEDTKQRETPV